MKFTFSENINIHEHDVVAIAGTVSFIEKKITEFIGNIPVNLLDKQLKYKEISKFDYIIDNKLVHFILICADKAKDAASIEKLGGYIFDAIPEKATSVALFNDLSIHNKNASSLLSSGIFLKSYSFNKYKSNNESCSITSIDCCSTYEEDDRQFFADKKNLDDGVLTARRLVDEPANIMTTEMLMQSAQDLKQFGIKVHVLDKNDMQKLGMNALLAVGQGSNAPSYTVVMEYITDKNAENVALIGKGLTFDSGGISIKPSKGMGEMKTDMAGAATVIGCMQSIAARNLQVNVIGAIGVVENMPSGTAQRPGDIVKAMSGTTIEVDNTDAEGRMVLADVLWYVQEKYNVSTMIDFATLTGAICVALGTEFAGLFSNSNELLDKLVNSGKATGEKLWPMPMHDDYDTCIKSQVADIKNTGDGSGAGSSTAAMFLKRFVKEQTKWAHIDIAGVAYENKKRALSQKGATGFGVRLINDFLLKI